MTDISIETVSGKLNPIGYESFIRALRQAKTAGNRHVELAHWLMQLLHDDNCDLILTLEYFACNIDQIALDLTKITEGFRKNTAEMPDITNAVIDLLDRGWRHYCNFVLW